MRILSTSPLLLAVALAIPSGAAAREHRGAAIAHPTAASAVVIQVETGGGFVAPGTILGELPAFTLYGDGTVIVPGAVPQISPGPAISPLLRRHLSERQVQALLRAATRAGLLARAATSYGDMGTIGVADAPTTTVHLNAAGRRVVRQAYALGFTAGSGRLPPAQATARRALKRFIDGLPRGLTGARYTPRGLAVYVAPYQQQAGVGGAAVVWPLSSDLATAGRKASLGAGYRCISLRGRDTATLLATLRRANDRSRFVVRGKPATAYALVTRPLLPDERNCGSLSR
jgi:hypothetical protein